MKDEGNKKGEEAVLKIPCFFGNVSDWLLLLIEGKDNGKGESVATSIQQWMLCIAYVHVHIWIRRRREGCLLR